MASPSRDLSLLIHKLNRSICQSLTELVTVHNGFERLSDFPAWVEICDVQICRDSCSVEPAWCYCQWAAEIDCGLLVIVFIGKKMMVKRSSTHACDCAAMDDIQTVLIRSQWLVDIKRKDAVPYALSWYLARIPHVLAPRLWLSTLHVDVSEVCSILAARHHIRSHQTVCRWLVNTSRSHMKTWSHIFTSLSLLTLTYLGSSPDSAWKDLSTYICVRRYAHSGWSLKLHTDLTNLNAAIFCLCLPGRPDGSQYWIETLVECQDKGCATLNARLPLTSLYHCSSRTSTVES